MAPVVRALENQPGIESRVCVTAQHRQMLDQVLTLFDISPDYDLDLMQPNQDLYDVTARVLLGLRDVIRSEQPDVILVQGDTTTCMAAALSAFYQHVRIGHVEAGLRTGNLKAPFPEEGNRMLVTQLADYNFAPTEQSRQNLLREAVQDEQIHVTGNTVIDALLEVKERLSSIDEEKWRDAYGDGLYERLCHDAVRIVLITGHRRENFGQGFIDLCNAIKMLASQNTDCLFIYPVHLNPNVRKPVFDILGNLENVELIEPLDYLPFVWMLNRCYLVLTDSGGIQEESPAFGKPVLVMREVTERPEGVESGTVKLVGTDITKIVEGVNSLLSDDTLYQQMSRAHNPYGDGKAAQRIVDVILEKAVSI